MKRVASILVVVALLVMGSSAMAGDALFLSTGWGGDGTWTGTGPNWGWNNVSAPVPTASDTAHLMIEPAWGISAGAIVNAAGAVAGTVNVGSSVFGAYNGELTVTSAGSLAVGTLNVSQSAGKTGTVTNSGTITVASTLQLGSAGTGTVTNSGTMTVGQISTGLGGGGGSIGILNNSGTFNATGVASDWFVLGYNGYGEINMNGGTMNIAGTVVGALGGTTGTGRINLNDGTINVGGGMLYNIGIDSSKFLVDISQGSLVLLNGDASDVDRVAWMANAQNMFTAYGHQSVSGGTYEVKAIYNETTDQTTIFAVPEPATMILLGLGGLLLRKKR